MSRFAPSPNTLIRLTRAGLIAFYTAIALLGSGGLHAIAPHGDSNCCTHQHGATVHAHRGCTHHHAHSHAETESCPKPDSAPAPDHHKSCAICEFAATPATAVAIIEPTLQIEAVDDLTVDVVQLVELVADSTFWSRGPPAVV
ncbi:MAG TPA: hypothetical protein VM510_10100 [Caulifigura sp.]|nr:hypothetical protein [Caulifigura sp.]